MNIKVLKVGSSGQEVRYLQDLLCRNGFETIIDGSFGPKTERQIKLLQHKLNLQIDGIVGPNTWETMSKKIEQKGNIYKKPRVIEHFIPFKSGKRDGIEQNPEWLTVHNTANPDSTAIGERSWLTNSKNVRTASWHYAVDDKHAVQVIPEEEVAWHAGDGKYGPGNRTSISIEVCESGDQQKTWENAVGLAANILYDRGWNIDRLTTHNRWTGKNCPRLIIPRWNEFVADTLYTLKQLETINQKKPKVQKKESIIDVFFKLIARLIGGKKNV